MAETAVCGLPGCGDEGVIVSRLSPEGYLVATGKKPIHLERHIAVFITVKIIMMN